MIPFTLRNCALAVANLGRQTRLDVLSIAFRIFTEWASVRIPVSGALPSLLQMLGIHETGSVILTEVRDLVRNLNVIVFCYHIIGDCDNLLSKTFLVWSDWDATMITHGMAFAVLWPRRVSLVTLWQRMD
jgi:hypothetical protein